MGYTAVKLLGTAVEFAVEPTFGRELPVAQLVDDYRNISAQFNMPQTRVGASVVLHA